MARDQRLEPVMMENVRLVFRNFTGKESEFNREGDRNFGVILPSDDVAEAMAQDGWNVKRLKPSEEEKEQGIEQGPPWLPVKVGYGKGRPPKIVQITSRGKTNLDEDTIDGLDWAEITNVDLMVRPYFWEVRGDTGISAYVQTMFVTIEEDPLEAKYADLDSQ
jgi:hypothetical protein